MRLVEGRTLDEALRDQSLSVADALRIAAQVARSLEEAELRGVVHRDIKPDNIMLSEPGNAAQVMDFGIARQAGGARLTTAGTFIGTPTYASPEAWGGEQDRRSDIYSLGATLYQMLAGAPPFQGEALDVLRQHRETAPPVEPLAAIDAETRDLVLRCLAKDPADRFQTASDLAGELERLASRKPTQADDVTVVTTEVLTVDQDAPSAGDSAALTLSLNPSEMRHRFLPAGRENSFELILNNASAHPVELQLTASADSDTVEFTLPARVAVASHDHETVTIDVRPRRRRWRGKTESIPFELSVDGDGDGAATVVTGEFQDRPDRRPSYVGGAAFSVVALTFAMFALIGGDENPGAPIDAPQLTELRSTVGQLSVVEYFQRLEVADRRVSDAIAVAIVDLSQSVQVALRDGRVEDAAAAATAFAETATAALALFSETLASTGAPVGLEPLHDDMVTSSAGWVAAIADLDASDVRSIADVERILGATSFVAATDLMNQSCLAMRDAAAVRDIAVQLNCESINSSALSELAPSADDENRQSVSVLLGPINESDGLVHPSEGDGQTRPETRAGRACRALVSNGSLVRYAYFDVDDSFIHAQRSAVDVTIEYFDEGNSSWWLEYDGIDLAFTDSSRVLSTDTQTWRTHTFAISDATFGNRQQSRHDFRIGLAEGGNQASACTVSPLSARHPASGCA